MYLVPIVLVLLCCCLSEATPVSQTNIAEVSKTNSSNDDLVYDDLIDAYLLPANATGDGLLSLRNSTLNEKQEWDPSKKIIRVPSKRSSRPRLISNNITPWIDQHPRPTSSGSSSRSDYGSFSSAGSSSISRSGGKAVEIQMTSYPVSQANHVIIPVLQDNSKSKMDAKISQIQESEKFSSISLKCDFKKLLNNEAEMPLSLSSFRDFCATAMRSPELLNFYDAVEKYKKLWYQRKTESNGAEDHELADMAQFIIQEFVDTDSEHQINLPDGISKSLLTNGELMVKVDMFDEAQNHVYEMLRVNALPRYLLTFRKNVSCLSKVPCSVIAGISAFAFTFHFIYQIVTGASQLDRLQLLPTLFFLVLSVTQIVHRFCVIYWVQEMMQTPVTTTLLEPKVTMLKVKDPVVFNLQRQYFILVLKRGSMIFLLLAVIISVIPSFPINRYRFI